jgi:ribonucleoside-diphosphate reductase alpha chain
VSPIEVAKKVIDGIYDGVTTIELDNLAAETAASLTTKHPDYAILAARIAVSNLHKVTSPSRFQQHHEAAVHLRGPQERRKCLAAGQRRVGSDPQARGATSTRPSSTTATTTTTSSASNPGALYLLRLEGKVVERPQHMLMRVAMGIHKDDIDSAIKTYNLLSERWFTHATPTLFNAGTPKPQMSSCFLLTMKDDSIDGIYDTLKNCALISQSAGGIGLSHSQRAGHGLLHQGHQRHFQRPGAHAEGVQRHGPLRGPGRRQAQRRLCHVPGALARRHLRIPGPEEEPRQGRNARPRPVLRPLDARPVHEARGRKRRLDADVPQRVPRPGDSWGEEFERSTPSTRSEGRGRKTIKAQELWFAILESQTETGTPYMLFKDAANRKSNQQNLGTIKSSNLCTEIIEYTDADEIAVCNLASLALPRFVTDKAATPDGFDHQKLYEVTYQATKNLNKVIDINYYPVPEAQKSNFRHRPIGLGVQGLADTFIALRMPFESDEATGLNKDIFETIYFAAMTASKDLAKKDGPYETFPGSPLSQGKFQFDLWNVTPDSGRWDWESLRAEVVKHGARNSLLVAPMPTASTAQILGNNESFEPYTSNIYVRRVLSGEFMVVNKHLLKDLVALGLWNDQMKQEIIAANGSVQNIARIPQHIKDLYKTVWEISQRRIIDHGRRPRGLHLPEPEPEPARAKRELRQAHQHALPLLEARPENRHVLPAHQSRRRRHQVHGGKASRRNPGADGPGRAEPKRLQQE